MGLRILRIVILISLIVFVGVGCSSSSDNPALPSEIPANNISHSGSDSHHLWGIWNIGFDVSGLTATTRPVRSLKAHFDITDMLLPPVCIDCMKLSVNSFDPATRILDADITIRNPSQLDAYDVRGILYTNDYGHELRNDDGWTKLFDIPGGSSINPFKAFAKDVGNRKFKPFTEHTENYQVYIPVPPHWNEITFAVTASWPSNCSEPYEITNFWQETITADVGSKGNIYIDVRDWQVDVNKVTLVAPEITGEDFTQFSYSGVETWSLQLTNNTGIGGGRYRARIIANSSNSGDVALYKYVDIIISEEGVPANPVDVTPPLLNFLVNEFAFDGNYAFMPAESNGLYIIDISDPSDPKHVKTVQTEGYVRAIAIENGYAYLPAVGPTNPPYPFQYQEFYIIDIDPPESAYVIKKVYMPYPGSARSVEIYGGHAYVAAFEGGLQIVDIYSPMEAHLAHAVDTPGTASGVAVADGYAYIADSEYGLQIIDIDPLLSSFIVNTVDTPGNANEVVVYNGYAYVADGDYGLQIIDVDPPQSAHIVSYIDSMDDVTRVDVSNGYAYIMGDNGLRIIKLW